MDGGTLHYVYDCGARSISHLEPIVSDYAKGLPRIDALFVSHLDGDHVDGLDTLLARLDVTTVYLPYLSLAERLLRVMEAEANDRRLTASFIQASFEPAQWFGSRGVERIVLVRNGGLPDETGVPSEPPRSTPEDRDRKTPKFHEFGIISQVSRPRAGQSSMLQMEVGTYLGVVAGGQTSNWILKPYVPTVDKKRTRRFEAKVREALCLKANESIEPKALTSMLKNPNGRKRLRSCYEEILPNGRGSKHNAISMSVYSGPSSDDLTWKVLSSHDQYPGLTERPGPVGWIGTGDAKLNDVRQRKKWLSFYKADIALTCSLLLPHHGSKANFHTELLRDTIHHCIASADELDEGYRHPSALVIKAINQAGKMLVHVTKRSATKFTEIVVSN